MRSSFAVFSRSSAFIRFTFDTVSAQSSSSSLNPSVVRPAEHPRPVANAEVREAPLERLVQLLGALLALTLVLAGLLLDLLELAEVLLARLLVDPGDHRGREVEDLLELLRSHVDQVADPAGDALEEPDVRNRRGEVDVAHPLAADLERVTSTPQRSQTMPL